MARARWTRRASPPDRPAAGRSRRCSAPIDRQRGERPLAPRAARDAPPGERGLDVGARRAAGERRGLQRGGDAAVPVDRAAAPAAIRPASAASSVDLPAPLGPSTARTSPRRSVRSTSWTTGVPARAAESPRASSSGSVTRDGRAPFSAWRCWIAVRAAARSRTRPSRRMPSAIAVPYSPAETRTSTALASVWVCPRCCRRRGRRRRPRRTRSRRRRWWPRARRRAPRAGRARPLPCARRRTRAPGRAGRAGSDWTAAAVSAATIGNASTAWARITPLSV